MYISMDCDVDLDLRASLEHADIGVDVEFIGGGNFEMNRESGTLKPDGAEPVFFIVRVVCRCESALYWKVRQSAGVNCIINNSHSFE